MSEELADFGATKAEIVDAVHAGANRADVARLEGAVWRLFDRVSGLGYFISARNDLLKQNQRLIGALTLITEMDGDQPARSDWDMVRIARAALKAAP